MSQPRRSAKKEDMKELTETFTLTLELTKTSEVGKNDKNEALRNERNRKSTGKTTLLEITDGSEQKPKPKTRATKGKAGDAEGGWDVNEAIQEFQKNLKSNLRPKKQESSGSSSDCSCSSCDDCSCSSCSSSDTCSCSSDSSSSSEPSPPPKSKRNPARK